MIYYDGILPLPDMTQEGKINIYLDDQRPCPRGFILAKTHWECAKMLDQNLVNILSLDHDLGDESFNGTGYDVAMHIVEQGLKNPDVWPRQIYLHTSNPVGRNNMYQLLTHYCPDDVKIYHYPYQG